MAARVQPLGSRNLGTSAAGILVAALLLFLTFGTLGAVAWRAETLTGISGRDWSAVWFTVWQAVISAMLSVLFAIPVARALARRQFRGRSALIALLGAPFILPVIVAVLGLLSVFGRTGVLNNALGAFGLEPMSIYGQHGVILAHVFFNLPLATRLILQGWLGIPAERFRLTTSLNFSSRDVFRHIEAPMLRDVVPGCFTVIFMICTTSFAIALTLGGGPKATTIELAIYQAFKFDFDLSKAAFLSLLQFAICALAALISLRVTIPQGQGAGLDRVVQRSDGSKSLDSLWIASAALFLLIPLAMIVARGAPYIFDLPPGIIAAAWRSVWVAILSAFLCIAMTLALALAAQRMRGLEIIGYLSIAASPLVIGTGLFVLTYTWIDPAQLALPITIVVNAAMSLPFALRATIPALTEITHSYDRLSASLGLRGWARLRIVVLPRLIRPLGFAGGLAAALSMGDLGVITLFADGETATLPLAMYRLMEAYRLDQAYGAALVLLTISLALFWLFDRGGRVNVDV